MSANVPSLPAAPWLNPLPAHLHKPVFGAFLLVLGADSLRHCLDLHWPEALEWLTPGVLLFAAATLLVGLARRLPAQNVVAVAVLAATVGFAVDTLNAPTDIPFGRRTFTQAAEPRWLGVAWFTPFLWITLAVGCRGVARLMLRPWRKLTYYGIWVMAAAIGLAVALAILLEPFGHAQGWWLRETRPGAWTWYGAPWVTFFGWALAVFAIYGVTTPWMLNKQPVKQPTDWHPLVVWELLLAWLALGTGLAGMGWALGAGAVAAVGVGWLAIRGGRW